MVTVVWYIRMLVVVCSANGECTADTSYQRFDTQSQCDRYGTERTRFMEDLQGKTGMKMALVYACMEVDLPTK